MSVNLTKDTVYGVSQAVLGVAPAPIISRRNPGINDRGMLGQAWVNRTTGVAFCLTSITANVYTWYNYAAIAAAVNTAGNVVAGTGLVATTGGCTVTAGGLTVTAGGAAITGNTAITGTLGVSSTITATLGNITATAGNLVSTLGNIHAINGNIYTDAGDIYSTLGDIEAVNGDVVVTTATKGITLPGPTRIINGAGIPANGLAVNIGDIYIRTDAAAINTRIYIATAAGAWTAVVTLA